MWPTGASKTALASFIPSRRLLESTLPTPVDTKAFLPCHFWARLPLQLQIYLDRKEALGNADWVYILRKKDDP
jgi:hypothetical protein